MWPLIIFFPELFTFLLKESILETECSGLPISLQWNPPISSGLPISLQCPLFTKPNRADWWRKDIHRISFLFHFSGLHPFGHQGLVLWKTIFPQTWGRGHGFRMLQVHCIHCAVYSCYYYISSTSLGPRGWGPHQLNWWLHSQRCACDDYASLWELNIYISPPLVTSCIWKLAIIKVSKKGKHCIQCFLLSLFLENQFLSISLGTAQFIWNKHTLKQRIRFLKKYLNP